MAQVLCTRPNAAEEISGVKFSRAEEGMLSEEISDERAAAFLEIPGYALVGAAEADGELAALVERAAALGITVKSTWKAQRLTAEIKRAEEAAAAAKTE